MFTSMICFTVQMDINRSSTVNTIRSEWTQPCRRHTMAASRFWRHSQDKRNVKLLLVEDAESSQQELPQLVLLDARVVLEKRKGGEFGRAAVSTGAPTDVYDVAHRAIVANKCPK